MTPNEVLDEITSQGAVCRYPSNTDGINALLQDDLIVAIADIPNNGHWLNPGYWYTTNDLAGKKIAMLKLDHSQGCALRSLVNIDII